MSAPEQERLEELVSLHALGVLSESERTELQFELRRHPTLASDLRAYERVVEALAAAVPLVDPPAALRERVLTSITGKPVTGTPSATAIARPQVPPPSRILAWTGWLAAAAALVSAVYLYTEGQRLQSRVQEAELRLASAEREVGELRRVLFRAESQTQVLQAQAHVLLAPDLARVDLAGQPTAASASGRAFWSRSRGMVFAASALPALPPDKVYQVWVVPAAQAPISAGLIKPDEKGSATAHFATAPDIPAPVALAVTLEPAPGVPQPTGEKILVGLANTSAGL